MKIQDWVRVALIIGAGDIGKCISDYSKTVAPKFDVIICRRNLTSQMVFILIWKMTIHFLRLRNKFNYLKNHFY